MCRALLGLILLVIATAALHATTVVFPAQTVVGSSATPLAVTVYSPGGGTIGSVTVLTGGIANQDFTLTDAGSCTTGAVLSTNGSCTVSIGFTPKYPGQRFGSVQVLDNNGVPMGATSLLAQGKGPLALFLPGQIQTEAGNDHWIYESDNVAATTTSIFLPFGIAVDGAQNLFIADFGNARIRRVDAVSGVITTVVGTGSAGYAGDGGPALSAQINQPSSIAIDGGGNLYFTDSANDVVRRVDAVTHVITTVAGMPQTQGHTGDGGPARSAKLNIPNGLALDGLGNLYVADSGNDAVRVIDLSTGTISAYAGNGTPGYTGDGSTATLAQLNSPWGVTVAANGDVYIADQGNNAIRKVSGVNISTFAGNGAPGFAGDGGTAAGATLSSPSSVSFDPAGDMYISDSGNNRIRKVNVTTGVIQTVVGSGAQTFAGDGGDATNAGLSGPYAMVVDGEGNLIVTDVLHNRVRRISSVNQTLFYAAIRVNRTSPPQTRTLENDGNDVLTFSSVTAGTNAAVDGPTTTCSTSTPLAISANCVVGADFAPTVLGNPVQGTINIASNSPNAPQVLTLFGQSLSLDPSNVALTSDHNPSAAGSSVTFTATVSGVAPTPSGTVTFYDGTTPLGTASTNAGGVATLSTTALTLGNHNITAAFGGDTNHTTGTSAVLVQQVKNGTTITVTADNQNVVYGTAVTFTAVATGAVSAPTGTVQFLDGTGNLLTGTLVASATDPKSSSVSVTTSTLSVGSHTIKASYAGDGTNLGNVSAPLTETVTQTSTTLSLGTSKNDSTFGVPLTLSATATSATGVIPTGTITFKDTSSGATLGTANLDTAGKAGLPLSTIPVGSHSIIAVYGGDTNDLPSTSAAIAQTIEPIATTTAVTSGNGTANAGASVVFTATVTPALTATPAPGGTVVFKDAGVILGTGTLSGNTATYSTTTLGLGSHSITATYSGATDYLSSVSVPYTQGIVLATTSGTLTAAPLPAVAGAALTLTGKITSAGAVPVGTVVFRDGTTYLGTGTLNATGTATLSVSTLAAGSHALSVYFAGDANNGSVTASLSLSVQQATTSVVLTSSGTPSVVGLPITLRATVSGNGGLPSGPVTFYDNTTVLGAGTPDGSGMASVVVTSLTVGSHTLSAVFAGDTNDLTSTSAAYTQVVQKTTTTTSLSSSALTAQQGTPVQFAAQVSSNAAVPGGTVYFYDGTTLLGSATLNGSGLAVFNVTNLIPGAHNITATYPGDVNQGASTSVGLSQVIQPVTAVGLSADKNPASTGATITLTAGVSGAGVVPTGLVTFADSFGGSNAILGTAHLNAAGVAAIQVSNLAAGSHAIKATYGGDANNSAGTSAVLNEVLQLATTSTVLTLPATAGLNTPVTLNVSVTGTGGTPTGQVSFTDGTTSLGTVPLTTGGTATLVVSSFGIGTHSIVASYGGDTNDAASASPAQVLTVQKATATIQIASSANPVLGGLPVTFTAVLQANYGTPSGTVTWYDGAAPLGTVAVSGAGTATYTTAALIPQSHTITASYSGDATFTALTSGSLTEVVNQGTSQTSLVSNLGSVLSGQAVTFSVGVTGTGGQPGGTAVLKSDGAVIATISLDGAGNGSFSTAFPSTGGHAITATYAGDANHTGSQSAPLSLSVNQAATAVALVSNRNPAAVGDTIVFMATVSGPASPLGGLVSLRDGGTLLGSAALGASGSVSFSVATLSSGSHMLTADYAGDANHTGAVSPTLTETVGQAASTVVLTSDKPQALTGETVTFTVAVSSAVGQPGGTATIVDGSTTLTTVQLDATGHGTFTTGALLAGTHNLIATYAGDASHLPGQSATLAETIQQVTGLSLASSKNPATVGDTLTFAVTLTGVGSVPAPVVVILDGTNPIGRIALDGNGQGTLVTSALATGTHTLSASFAGDANHAPALSANLIQVVQPASSTLTLDSSKNPAATGDSVNFTVAVSGAGGAPGGVVTILDGSTSIGTAVLNSNGIGSFTTATLTAGTHNLTASYPGDTNHAPAVSTVLAQVVLQPTTTTVVSNNNPALGGRPVTFTAAVTAANSANANGQISGTVTFRDGVSVLGTVPVSSSGAAALTTATLALGDHSVTAVYSGDGLYSSSVSAPIVQSIQTVATITTLTANTDHLVYAANAGSNGGGTAPLTLTAVVSDNGTPATGTVQFLDGSALLGTATVGAGGSATLTVTTLGPGPHILLAIYKGDANHQTSTSNPLTVPVLQRTAVSLAASANPLSVQAPFALQIAVANGSQNLLPTGTVTVRDGSTVLGTVVLSASGTATLPVLGLPAGQHTLVATYDGDSANTSGISSPLAVEVDLYADTNTLKLSAANLLHGESVTLTATLQGKAAVPPSGTVVFSAGGKTLGSAALNASGVATLTLTPDDGSYSITAVYAGDSLYVGSTSAAATLTVAEPPSFTVSLNPSSMSLSRKQHSTIQITLTSSNGFSDNLALGCVGLPQAATCTFSTDHQAMAANSKQTVSLTIDTGSPLVAGGAAAHARNEMAASRLKLCALPLGCLLSFAMYRRRKSARWLGGLLALVLLLGSTGLTGCGSLDVNGTPAGAYTFQVTAIGAKTSVTQSAPMALTVTQ